MLFLSTHKVWHILHLQAAQFTVWKLFPCYFYSACFFPIWKHNVICIHIHSFFFFLFWLVWFLKAAASASRGHATKFRPIFVWIKRKKQNKGFLFYYFVRHACWRGLRDYNIIYLVWLYISRHCWHRSPYEWVVICQHLIRTWLDYCHCVMSALAKKKCHLS